MIIHENIVVLNADYSYLNIVSWRRAWKLIHSGKAEVVRYSEDEIRNYEGTVRFKLPQVIKLFEFIKSIYKCEVPFSKRNVHIRDDHACCYCGAAHKKMTIDHVMPMCRGGKTTWDNCVSACWHCNNRKGSKTLEQSGMRLQRRPYKPTAAQFIQQRIKNSSIAYVLDHLFD